MRCTQCGNEYENHLAACPYCGVANVTQGAFCPNCGQQIAPGSVVCGS
ncbi:MAG: zinc ribbon domain-containing protein, partial [Clostridia bacterium]|nr:zinc ribbon domain-containing protein [Clostridia bacterium]